MLNIEHKFRMLQTVVAVLT